MRLTPIEEQQKLLSRFEGRDLALVSGGSLANSMIAFAQLGGKACFCGCVGDDRYGMHYVEEFSRLGIALSNPMIARETTGTCVSIITPDAERTMRTSLGVASHLNERHVPDEFVERSEWLFIEGYLFTNRDSSHSAIRKALRLAREHNTKIAFTFSESFIVGLFPDLMDEVISQAAMVFANEQEACAYTGEKDVERAFDRLKNKVPGCVVSAGPRGAFVHCNGEEGLVPAYPAKPRDLTGAGDMLAGAFLYGITHGVKPLMAARGACYLAKQVIEKIGARLESGVRESWDEVVQSTIKRPNVISG
jgi:sugar/nucleoside kinase (ribokinase family)